MADQPDVMPPDAPMKSVRGTLIIADQVYKTIEGKWVIAGTYSSWSTSRDDITLYGVQAYIRLQFEHVGDYTGSVLLIDRSEPSTHPAIAELPLLLRITNTQEVAETGIRFPELTVQCPIKRHDRKPGEVIVMEMLVWLKVGGHDVASARLAVYFTPGPALNAPDRPSES